MSRSLSILVAGLLALGACGEPGPGPVALDPDFSPEVDVMNLLRSKWGEAARDPDSMLAHRTLGLAFLANGGWQQGEECFRIALSLDPDDAESRYQLARALAQRGDFEGQAEELRRVVEGAPDFVAARYALACADLDAGRLDEAASHFRTVQAEQPALMLGEMGLGLVALERGDPGEAIRRLGAAAERNPADAFIRFQLGQAYLASGDEARAKALLEGLVDAGGRPTLRSPGTVTAEAFARSRSKRIQRAIDRVRAGEYSAAIPELRTLVDRDPSDVAAANNLAVAYIETGQLDLAEHAIEVALAADPNQYASYVNRASCALARAEAKRKNRRAGESRADLEVGLSAIDRAIELSPRFGRSHVLRGTLLAALRLDEDARAAYRSGIDLGEVDESTYVGLAKVIARTSGPEAATEALREGLTRGDGPRLQLRFEICGMLLAAGRGAEARAAQVELRRIAPDHRYTKLADRLLREKGL